MDTPRNPTLIYVDVMNLKMEIKSMNTLVNFLPPPTDS